MLEQIFVLLLLFVGTYLTIGTKFFPVRNIGKALKSIFTAPKTEGKKISVFSSLCTTLAATIGTGNIVGVASAVTVGGPGALFWMVVGSLVCMTIKYAENILAVRYRFRDRDGNLLGGPFAYIERGLGQQYSWLSKVFCLACLCAGILGMGTIIQSGSIAGAVNAIFPNTHELYIADITTTSATLLTASVVTFLTGLVIFGGVSRIASVSEKIVPFMAACYTLVCAIILIKNCTALPRILVLMVKCAFSSQAAGGAITGLTVQQIVYLGIQRGVFSNEAGLGTSAIAAASADDPNEVRHGYAGIVSVFIDTVVLCTLTDFTVIITGASGNTGVEAANASWALGLPWSPSVSRGVLSAFIIIFGFTSILGWNFFVERCLCYLFHNSRITALYQALYLAAVFLGPFLSVDFAWRIADLTNAFMGVSNLIAIFLLRRDVYDSIPKLN